jgi:hypothetical protein
MERSGPENRFLAWRDPRSDQLNVTTIASLSIFVVPPLLG